MANVPPPKRHPYDQWSPDARALDLVGDKWTLLIVRDLISGPRRFIELQRVLPGISTEQLRSRLNRMVADGLLTRKRYREVPPRVDYELTERSRDLMPVLGALAQWGYQWAWGPPRSSEAIDLGAIFRVAVGNFAIHGRTGTIEATVNEPGRSISYAFTVTEHGIQLAEREAGGADARITGSRDAWVAALSPDQNRSGLEIAGNLELAATLLDGLSGQAQQAGAATRVA